MGGFFKLKKCQGNRGVLSFGWLGLELDAREGIRAKTGLIHDILMLIVTIVDEISLSICLGLGPQIWAVSMVQAWETHGSGYEKELWMVLTQHVW